MYYIYLLMKNPAPEKLPALTAKRCPARRCVLVIGAFLIVLTSFAQPKSYIKKFDSLADSLSREYSIPKSVILGVSMIESGAGTSRNCKLLNNYFGIVGKNQLYKKGMKSRYKQYASVTASFVDFCKLMTKKKFYKKLKGDMNYKPWLDAISKNGYSEVPELWRQRVTAAIRKHKLSETV